MKQLKAAFLEKTNVDAIELVAADLDKLEKHLLEFAPWPKYSYKPRVQFSIAHTADSILLKYYVEEKTIRAAAGTINGNVWEDSCVEFFISFDGEAYYNLEFNCIGTALVGYGKNKTDRELLPEAIIKEIRFQASIQNKDNLFQWQLTVVIPLKVFIHHHFTFLTGKSCRVNFYKCGDALPEPHFISWSNIQSEELNFHLSEFFGEALFI